MILTETAAREELVKRVRSEFLEMPGLQLNVRQCRLWGLDQETCDELLNRLVHAKFLCRTRTGGFARTDIL